MSKLFGHSFGAGWTAAIMVGFFLALFGAQTQAQAEKRTLSFYFGHTKESISVTYKRNGVYDKKGLKKLNWFFRDWRRNASTRMDPELFDLIWNLKRELRAKKPIHVISGFRSSRTNKKLRRMGRKVARRSQHVKGRAIDLYFPDVPLVRLRNAALVRERGGVGFYPRSGSKGFVHVDTGTVRHWPRMSRRKLASIFRKHKKYRRSTPAPVYIAKNKKLKSKDIKTATTQVALAKPRNKPAVFAALSNKARAALKSQIAKSAVPVPRSKPYAVLAKLQGQQDVTIQPASAPAQVTNFATKRNPNEIAQAGTLGTTPLDITPQLRAGSAMFASAGTFDNPVPGFWKASRRHSTFAQRTFRRDGSPQRFKQDANYSGPVLLGAPGIKLASATGKIPNITNSKNGRSKGRIFSSQEMARIEAQSVNRNGKTSLASTPAVRQMRPKIAPLDKQALVEYKRMESIAIEAKPLSFD